VEDRRPVPWTLASIIRRHARERPTHPALTFGARTLAWGDLDARSSRVAQGLLAAGVRPQERVALVDKNGPEYFEVLFGGGKANVVNVAVNWRLTPREMADIVNDAEARVLFVGPDFLGHLDAMEAGLRTIRRVIVLGAHARHETYEAWLARQSAADPGTGSGPDDVAMQLYTSGTTGLPKGAMLTNANLGTLMPNVSTGWSLDGTSINLVVMPLFHIGGSGWALVGMWHGCHSILLREFLPREILEGIPRHRVTNALFVPAMLQVLATLPGAADRDYSSLRSIAYGASPITDEVLTRAMETFRCDFIQLYGLTETTGAITQLDPADHDPGGPRRRLLRSAGKPYPWVELRIADPVTGQPRGPAEIGEVWTRSPQTFAGYWNRREDTARAFAPEGWLRTGDAGYLDREGYLFLTDRVKDMICSAGENVYPAEVENVVAAHPAVADVAVIGVPDDKWGETVKAVVVRRPGADPAPAAIIAFARERLAHYKCPTSVDFVDALPRTPSGKVLKRELREPYWHGLERRIH
jgi:long-chain acyl-CoA synthetase